MQYFLNSYVLNCFTVKRYTHCMLWHCSGYLSFVHSTALCTFYTRCGGLMAVQWFFLSAIASKTTHDIDCAVAFCICIRMGGYIALRSFWFAFARKLHRIWLQLFDQNKVQFFRSFYFSQIFWTSIFMQ